jgi:ankyrin repeat protein
VNAKCHNIPCLHLALTATLLPGGKDFGMKCFTTLLAQGCSATAKDDRGYSVLHVAAKHNLVEAMALLFEYLEPPADLINWSSKINGITALHCAARADAADAASLLVRTYEHILQ